MSTFTEDDSLSVIINSRYNTNLNETAFFFSYTTFCQLFPFAEMIRGDKNDLISLAVLLFLVAVYAHLQRNQQTLLACCACWPHCMIAVIITNFNITSSYPCIITSGQRVFNATVQYSRIYIFGTFFTDDGLHLSCFLLLQFRGIFASNLVKGSCFQNGQYIFFFVIWSE